MNNYITSGDKYIMRNEVNGTFLLEIVDDLVCENPRELALSTIVSFDKKYDLSDKSDRDFDSVGDFKEYVNSFDKNDILVLPLYLYEHSNLVLETTRSDAWDSRFVGFVYMQKKVAMRELVDYVLDEKGDKIKQYTYHSNGSKSVASWTYKTKPLTQETWKKRAKEIIGAELEVYNNYLNGEVYGFNLYKLVSKSEVLGSIESKEIIRETTKYCWDEVDSVFGFYGNDIEENGMLDNLPFNLKIVGEYQGSPEAMLTAKEVNSLLRGNFFAEDNSLQPNSCKMDTSMGIVKATPFTDGDVASGIKIHYNNELVALFDVINANKEFNINEEARLLIYADPDIDEPTHVINLNAYK